MKELDRSLGLVAVVAISLSAMLGSGIFVLPGIASSMSGSSVWLAYLVAGLGVVPAALSKAELSTAMPTSGGTYIYMDRAFGPLYGTVAGIALWLSMLLKSSFALLGVGTYLVIVLDVPYRPTAVVLLLLITVINILGVKKVGKAQVIVIGVSLAAIITFTIASIPTFDRAKLIPFAPHGAEGIFAAAAFVFVSYNGVTKIAAIAEEVQNPSKNLPLGILISLTLAMVIYAGVSFSLVGNVESASLVTDLHPIYTLAHRALGPIAGIIASIVGVLTMTSMANAGLLAASRFPFAMSRGSLLPSALATVHPKLQTPIPAVLLSALAMAFAVTCLEVKSLAKLASAIIIMMYIAVNAAVVVLREASVQWYKPSYRAPFYPWTQAGGMLAGTLLLFALGPSVTVAGLLIFLPGFLIFLFYGKGRAPRRGAVGKIRKRVELLRNDELDADTQERQTMQKVAAGDAAAVVALFGDERSPETLADVALALARGRAVQIVHCTEVPEQALLDVLLDEDVAVQSLRRRFRAMEAAEDCSLDFHAMVSRDLLRTIHNITSRTHCEWLIMQRQGRSRFSLLPRNPIGWLINHLQSNLATFKDAGVRYVRRILVRAEPGPHDALVVGTAEHLATLWGAETTFVRFVPASAGSDAVRREEDYLGQVKRLYGGSCRTLISRGESEVSTMAQLSAAFDLLITSSPDLTIVGLLRGTVEERILRRAACSVLTVRTPRMRTHAALSESRSSVPPEAFRLRDFVLGRGVQARLSVHKKDALFQHIGKVFAESMNGISAKEVVEALWQREKAQNTSVGHGVAIPHATVSHARRSYVAVFTTETPIDYQGPDGRKVDVFFAMLGPPSEREMHLHLLSMISRAALQTPLLSELRSASTDAVMRQAIDACALDAS